MKEILIIVKQNEAGKYEDLLADYNMQENISTVLDIDNFTQFFIRVNNEDEELLLIDLKNEL